MTRIHTSQRAIDAALAYLNREQLPNGEFPAIVARDVTLQQERRIDHTPFVTAYAAYSLSHVRGERAAAMLERALDFLEREMEAPGVWRYWSTDHPHHRHTPPDADDTCCAAFVLRRNARAVPDLTHLLLANRDGNGLFYTWFVPRLQPTAYLRYWHVTLREILRLPYLLGFYRLTEANADDVDGVVNANVLLYLGAHPATAPVARYLQRELEARREAECDKWHLNAFAFYYAVTRALHHGTTALEPLSSLIVARITARQKSDGSFGNASETALGAAALVNLNAHGPVLSAAIERLLAWQRSDGSWEAHALYFGGPKRYYGWGSESLTTALCLEVLARTSGAASATE